MSLPSIPTIEQVARQLVKWHAQEDTMLEAVYWYPDEHEIRLVEVSGALVRSADEIEVLPFGFGATAEVPYRSVVILLSPAEWQRVTEEPELLPAGFDHAVQIFPAA